MTWQGATAVMCRKAVNTRIRQGTTPTSYPTHISVLKDKEWGPWRKDQQITKRHIGFQNILFLSPLISKRIPFKVKAKTAIRFLRTSPNAHYYKYTTPCITKGKVALILKPKRYCLVQKHLKTLTDLIIGGGLPEDLSPALVCYLV